MQATLMQAIVYHTYGSPDVLNLEEVQKPVAQEGEILVKIVAASAAAGDWHLMRADPFPARFMYGFFTPKYKILLPKPLARKSPPYAAQAT